MVHHLTRVCVWRSCREIERTNKNTQNVTIAKAQQKTQQKKEISSQNVVFGNDKVNGRVSCRKLRDKKCPF